MPDPRSLRIFGAGMRSNFPMQTELFDIVYCHFLLLWVSDPLQALLEMKRVAKEGVHILAFAEPDYTGRIDKPRDLIPWGNGRLNPCAGRAPTRGWGAARGSFFRAGIELLETGTIQSAESDRPRRIGKPNGR